ncbi:pmr5/Cas1p GDSL/SGNH-like acyl-esterase family protein [Tasmannia lanceolata]|uniref:pmr5/Cas1p GDSL/SGNH-like acyl-esterase family protein n=1 Tax=Tasmannia lanceolata TaxID=3420 RepID=UPI00406453CD
MIGTVQFGLLAASIVLFVPMGMAGWHLSRNKMLFFSGILFITLFVGVHLTPYFPSVSDFVSSFSSVVLENRDSCISFLHEIVWDETPKPNRVDEFSANSSNYDFSWAWAKSTPVIACGFQRLGQIDASDLLNGSWVVVAGDSQARLFVLSLLNLVLDSTQMEMVEGDLFKRHSDYHIVIEEHGVKLDFIWAPYGMNLTDVLKKFKHDHRYPDVLVMGSGLWHMLHFTNASDYGLSLGAVRRLVESLLPVSPKFGTDGPVTGSVLVQTPHIFWLGMPTLINSMLNTEEKIEKMNQMVCDAYDKELNESKLLRQSGGPLILLDVGLLSRNCGLQCTVDGMHYNGVVYDAALQIMLNALLIESQQRI